MNTAAEGTMHSQGEGREKLVSGSVGGASPAEGSETWKQLPLHHDDGEEITEVSANLGDSACPSDVEIDVDVRDLGGYDSEEHASGGFEKVVDATGPNRNDGAVTRPPERHFLVDEEEEEEEGGEEADSRAGDCAGGQAACEGSEIMIGPFCYQAQPLEQNDTGSQPSAELARNESATPVPGERHGSTASPPPPPSTAAAGPDGVVDTMEDQELVRTKMPSYSAWKLNHLKAECVRIAGPRQGLKYGAFPDEVLTSISNAKKDDLIAALITRQQWLESSGRPADWEQTPLGITPEKAKKPSRSREENNRNKSKKGETIRKSEAYACRLAALTVHPHFWEMYMASRRRPSRAETDARQIGSNHAFYKAVARAMVDPEWKDSDGNKISIPDDHSNDSRAPDRLRIALEWLDLEGAALSLQEEQQKWDSVDEFLDSLRERCAKWVKEIRTAHEEYVHREDTSGGVGADEDSDGEAADAIHAFQFMDGKLATMIWEDGLRAFGGTDEGGNARAGDVMIPDSSEMSGSSVPGGPGVLSAAERHRHEMATDTQEHPLSGSRDTTSSLGGQHLSLSGEEVGAISQEDDCLMTLRDEELTGPSSVDVSIFSPSGEEVGALSQDDDGLTLGDEELTAPSSVDVSLFSPSGEEVSALSQDDDGVTLLDERLRAASSIDVGLSLSDEELSQSSLDADDLSQSNDKVTTMSAPKAKHRGPNVVAVKAAVRKPSPAPRTGSAAVSNPPPSSASGKTPARKSSAASGSRNRRKTKEKQEEEVVISCKSALGKLHGMTDAEVSRATVDDHYDEDERRRSRLKRLLIDADKLQQDIGACGNDTLRNRYVRFLNLTLKKVDLILEEIDVADALEADEAQRAAAAAAAAAAVAAPASTRTRRATPAARIRGAKVGAVSPDPVAATTAPGNGGSATGGTTRPVVARKKRSAAGGAVSSMPTAAALCRGAGGLNRAETLSVARKGRTAVVRVVSATSASAAAAARTVGAAAARAAKPAIRRKERDAVAGLGSTTPETYGRQASREPALLLRPASATKGRVGITGAVATSSAPGIWDRPTGRTERPAVHAWGRGAVPGVALSTPGAGRTSGAGTASRAAVAAQGRGAVIRTVSRAPAATGSGGGGRGGVATDSRPMVRKNARAAVVGGLSSRTVAAAGGAGGGPRTATTPAVAGQRAGSVGHVETLRQTPAVAAAGVSAGAGRAANPAVGGREGSAHVAAAGSMPVMPHGNGTPSSRKTSPLIISGRKRAAGGPVVLSPQPAAALLSARDGLGGHANPTVAVEGTARTGRRASYEQGTGSSHASARGAGNAPPDRRGHASVAPSIGAFPQSAQTVHALAYATNGGVAMPNADRAVVESAHRAWSAPTTASADGGGMTLHGSYVAGQAEGPVNRGSHGTSGDTASG